MKPRKNTSIRLHDAEREELQAIADKAGIKPSVVMQKAIQRFIRAYVARGASVLYDDEAPPKNSKQSAADGPTNRISRSA